MTYLICTTRNVEVGRTVHMMEIRQPSHPISAYIARDAGRFLSVIDHVLALDYLKPELRRRVVRLQRDLIKAEVRSHYFRAPDGEE